jgi:type II secretion system protein G
MFKIRQSSILEDAPLCDWDNGSIPEYERGNKAMRYQRSKGAFTLIELLIVVAIIAILAAIAVPNFLEAQARSKMSRVKADLRSIATALESYRVDNNDYPPELPEDPGFFIEFATLLTTPVAYMTSVKLKDPFQPEGQTLPYFPPHSSFFYFRYNGSWANNCYGDVYKVPGYSLFSNGPVKTKWSWIEHYPYFKITKNPLSSTDAFGVTETRSIAEDTVYEASNGTISRGGIARFGGLPGIAEAVP